MDELGIECLDLVRDPEDPWRVHLVYSDTGEIKESGTYYYCGEDPHWPYRIRWDDARLREKWVVDEVVV